MSDVDLFDRVARLLALLDGLPDMRRCACKRIYRVNVAAELQQTMMEVSKELHRRGAAVPETVRSRFELLELD